MIPIRNPFSCAGRPGPWIALRFLLSLSFLLLALGLLLSIRFDHGDGAIPSTTIAPLSRSQGQASFNSPDFNIHLKAFERAVNPANILASERRPAHRGIPDHFDLPPLLLFTALGLGFLQVPWGLQCLEDNSPRVRLRVCRARPPTFHYSYH